MAANIWSALEDPARVWKAGRAPPSILRAGEMRQTKVEAAPTAMRSPNFWAGCSQDPAAINHWPRGNSSEAKASRVIIYKFPVKLPFPVHSGLQRASTSRHVHSNGVPGRHSIICACVNTYSVQCLVCVQ